MGSFVALVVEDSTSMRELLVHALERIPDIESVEARNGLDALRLIAEGTRPDIILSDINMPVMDGLKLVARVRGDSELRDVPIVMVTTEGGALDRDRALSLGASAYVTKPVKAAELVARVRELLPLE